MNKCFSCDKPATLQNHTQFGGTHYWCQDHVPLEDLQDCTPIITTAAKEFVKPQAHEVNNKTQYLLDKLQEEAAEIIQAVSKIRRFGPHNHHPDRTTTNLQELVGELEDLQAVLWALEEINYWDPKPSTTQTIRKYNLLQGTQ